MHAFDIVQRLRHPHPARQHGHVGDETHVLHEAVALGPGIAPEHLELALVADEDVRRRHIAVNDIEAARKDLIGRGAKVSDVFQYAGGPFNNTGKNPRVSGRDPQDRSYFSFASFEDPDGNGYLLQEIKTRLPGREWQSAPAGKIDIATLAELLHETEQHHGSYEKTHGKHNWWDWYAPYLSARQNGKSPDEASAAANLYMDEVILVSSR